LSGALRVIILLLHHILSDGTASASHYTQIRARKGNSLSLSAPCRSYSTMIPACQTLRLSGAYSRSKPVWQGLSAGSPFRILRYSVATRPSSSKLGWLSLLRHFTILIKSEGKGTHFYFIIRIFAPIIRIV